MLIQVSEGGKGNNRFWTPPVLGGGGSFSAYNSRSTVTYNPNPNVSGYDLPQNWINSAYPTGINPLIVDLISSGNTTTNQTILQDEIESAAIRARDTVLRLPSGWHSKRITLKRHTQGPYRTYIEWINKNSVSPLEGYRANTLMFEFANPSLNAPILDSDGTGAGCVWCEIAADGYRFTGIHFKSTDYPSIGANSILNYRLVNISAATGSDETVQTDISKAPRDIGLDRCWVNGQNLGRHINGVVVNGYNCYIVDSVVNGIWSHGFESHGIVGFNSPGLVKVVGNEIEAASINFFIGGVVPDTPLLQTYDIEFRRNYVHKRRSWNPNDPTYDHFIDPLYGVETTRTVKNLYEMKWCNRVLIEGNIFEENWSSAQQGAAICFKTENSVDPSDPGGKTDAVSKNVTFRHNITRNSSGALELIGHGFGGGLIEQTNRVEIYNNLFYEIANDRHAHATDTGVSPCGILVSEGLHDLYMRHNTFALTTGAKTRWGRPQLHIWDGSTQSNLTFLDNIFHLESPSGGQSIYPANISPAPVEGTATLQFFTSGAYIYSKNVFTNAQQNGNPYPAASFYPASVATIQFTDYANSNFRLAGGPYKNAATDGTDIGCNQDTIELATQNVVTGT